MPKKHVIVFAKDIFAFEEWYKQLPLFTRLFSAKHTYVGKSLLSYDALEHMPDFAGAKPGTIFKLIILPDFIENPSWFDIMSKAFSIYWDEVEDPADIKREYILENRRRQFAKQEQARQERIDAYNKRERENSLQSRMLRRKEAIRNVQAVQEHHNPPASHIVHEEHHYAFPISDYLLQPTPLEELDKLARNAPDPEPVKEHTHSWTNTHTDSSGRFSGNYDSGSNYDSCSSSSSSSSDSSSSYDSGSSSDSGSNDSGGSFD